MRPFPLPIGVHWLGDREAADTTRHAVDVCGCVLYFNRQSDCLQFMQWLTGIANGEKAAEV